MKTQILIIALILGMLQHGFCQLPHVEPFVLKPTYDSRSAAEFRELLIRKMELEKEESEKGKQKIISKLHQTKSIYSSINNLPLKIKDGWHNVVVTNGFDTCEDAKVYVGNNQITKYVIYNWLDRPILFSKQILQGKGLIKSKNSDGTDSEYFDVYFIDYCLDNDSQTSPPMRSGKVTFWTNWKRANTVTIYFMGVLELGQFTRYFDSVPNCEQDGTVNLEFKPGTYSYKAIGTSAFGSEVTWEGKIILREGSCTIQGLKK